MFPQAVDATLAQRVPFVALRRQHDNLDGQLQAAFRRVLDTDAFILGEEVERFEQSFADYCGASHCVGVASGTAALTLALVAAGIGPGDEVILPAHTFVATGLAVLHAGATPVLCDVEEETALIDVRSAEAAIGERTAAIVAVHLYGQVCDMDALGDLARRHKLALLEDAAQAHGAEWRGRKAGSFGLAAGFSFYPSKNLGALGDGGAVCTNDAAVAAAVRRLRHLGQERKGDHEVVGHNERLDGLQAAFLSVKLPFLDGWNATRRRLAACYRRGLAGEIRPVVERDGGVSAHHLFPVRVPDRDGLRSRLDAAGIDSGLHYSPALHGHPPFARARRADGGLGRAEAWAAQALTLPMSAELDEAEVARVVDACNRLVGDR